MARECWLRRCYLSIYFFFVYFWTVVTKDLPRVLFARRRLIRDEVVVITGGAMGIGKAMALRVAVEHAAKVVILDVNETEGYLAVKEIESLGGRAVFYSCDISRIEELEACKARVLANPMFGQIDILVCNAAILKFGSLIELSVDDFRRNSDVNILGHIYTVKTFLPHFIRRNKGHVVSIGSICSYYGEHLGSAYCTAKFACRGFMEALKMELIEQNLEHIELTSIYPYFVNTRFVTDVMEEPFSTFWDVLPVEKVADEAIDAILRGKLSHFIPGDLFWFCVVAKSLMTKSILEPARRLFNVTYKPKTRLTQTDLLPDIKVY